MKGEIRTPSILNYPLYSKVLAALSYLEMLQDNVKVYVGELIINLGLSVQHRTDDDRLVPSQRF